MNATDSTRRPVLWGPKAGWGYAAGGLLAAQLDADGSRTAYLFFPLWLGLHLVVDALVLSRTRTSPRTRSRQESCCFVVSVRGLVAV